MSEKRYLLTKNDLMDCYRQGVLTGHYQEKHNGEIPYMTRNHMNDEWLEAHEYRPIDMGVRELKEWAFANMEGCDEPEWTLFSTINDAVERYWEAVEQ